MGRLAVLACVLAACSPSTGESTDAPPSQGSDAGVDPNDGAKSGARLKLTWYQFTDGTRQFSGMYDSENKETCSPYYASFTDGKTYCVPRVGGDAVYTNSTCTNKILHYYVDSVCPQDPAKYFLDYATVGCQSHPAHIYLRGAKLANATYYYKSSTGTCSTGYAPQSYDAFYALGSEVPKSALVELTLSAPEGQGRVGVRFYESVDGMRFPWVLHDATLDADCSAEYAADNSSAARCTPDDARYSYLAHDATCSQPALALANTCTKPAFAYTFPETSCPGDSETYYAVGAQIASTPLYQPTGGTCTATSASANTSYYALGAPVSLASLSYAADTGTAHRIQLIHYTSTEGTRFRDPYRLYDAEKGSACYPETLPDGTTRCVAFGGYIDTYYTSSACTTPIDLVEVYKGPATCSAPVVPKYARKDIAPQPGTCQYGTEVHTITSPHSGSVYYGGPGSCFLFDPYEGVMYNVGPTVPLTDFVAAAQAMDN
ncbi:MAG: hypothetical protein ABI678_21545 [Kofleriaceae bacterium]